MTATETSNRSRLIEMAQETLSRAVARRDAQTHPALRAYYQQNVEAAERTLNIQMGR